MMKRILLLVCLFIGISSIAVSQEFKCFRLRKGNLVWNMIYERNKPLGEQLLMEIQSPNSNLLFSAVHSFPEKIKKEIIKDKKRLGIHIYVNSNGEVSFGTFAGSSEDEWTLTEKQWLKIVRIMENIKLDVSKLKIIKTKSNSPAVIKSKSKDPVSLKSELKKQNIEFEWYAEFNLEVRDILSGELYLDSNGKICRKGKK